VTSVPSYHAECTVPVFVLVLVLNTSTLLTLDSSSPGPGSGLNTSDTTQIYPSNNTATTYHMARVVHEVSEDTSS
jgi:hypothetical protein